MIVAERLGKRFGRRDALVDATFRVERGEVVGFLGPNGAGKTTALRILAGVFPPTSGRALVGGRDVSIDSQATRLQVGYAPERAALYPEMTVTSLLTFVAAMREAGREAVGQAIARTRLEPLADRRIRTLSKGMRQRVGLAVALVGDPPVLLLDEPTAGLDPGQRSETRRLVRSLSASHAILLSSHMLGDVEGCCDRIVVLHHGRVLAAGPPAALATELRALPVIRLAARAPARRLAEALEGIAGVDSVTVRPSDDDAAVVEVTPTGERDVRPALAACVHDAGWDLVALEERLPSLEDVFLRLVGE